jgi:hypothetical protein
MPVQWDIIKHSKARIAKQLSDTVPNRNVLKQGDALSPLLFDFAFVYDIT